MNLMLRATYANMRVLVTGGAGFIGSHLVEALVSYGAIVRVFDNLSTGLRSHLDSVEASCDLVVGDITDAQSCHEAMQGIDMVFHLAAQTSVPCSLENPYACYATNVYGTLNILEAMRIHAVRRCVFASSAAVYGAHEGICYEQLVCRPISPYGASKLIGELLCAQYGRSADIYSVCLRYFNVYGDRQRVDLPTAGVIARMRSALAHNVPLTLHGDGLQQRDFISVDDIVRANLIVGALLQRHEWAGEPFNIGSGVSVTIRAMLERLHKDYQYYNLDEQIQYAPARRGDVRCSQADCTKYRLLCGAYAAVHADPLRQTL